MELRDIEVFLTLCEELHFGRTAQRLHLSQPRVSQSIAKQERAIGAPLFDRTSRVVTLTPIGEQLRNDLLPMYQGLHDSLERARMAAQGLTEVLRVGIVSSNAHDLRPFWDTFRARHPQWGLRIRHNPFIYPFAPLRRGEIDVLIAWLPVEEPDLTVGPTIYAESQVLMVAADHPLTQRDSVTLEVLGDHVVLGTQPDFAPEYWEDAYVPFYTPKGRPVRRLRTDFHNLDDILTVISAGEAVHPIFAHAVRYHARPDIAFVPILGGRPGRWALVWRTDAESELVRAFARIVQDLGTLTS